MNITITDHAYDRAKQRLGYSKKTTDRMAEKAYDGGISHGETNGMLFKYIAGLTNRHKRKGSCIKLYGDAVYIFINRDKENAELVTVYQIPNNLKDKSNGKQRRKKEDGTDKD